MNYSEENIRKELFEVYVRMLFDEKLWYEW